MLEYPILCDPRFTSLLEEFDQNEIADGAGTTYGLWPDLTLAFANRGWSRFARKNGGEPSISTDWNLGCCILEAVAEPLRPFFAENYRRCLQESRPWEHLYECSSAEVYRKFHMTAFPLGESEGLLIINSLRIEKSHTRVSFPPLEERYRNTDGFVVQCCHCRRISRVENESAWDWVPDWVKHHPDKTSHGICPACFGFYYAESRLNATSLVKPFSTIA